MFRLEFSTDNDSFGNYTEHEVYRILSVVRKQVRELNKKEGVIKDINGNTVGSWVLENKESERIKSLKERAELNQVRERSGVSFE